MKKGHLASQNGMLGQRSEVYFVVYKYKTHLRKYFEYKNHLLQMNRVGVGVFGLFLANEWKLVLKTHLFQMDEGEIFTTKEANKLVSLAEQQFLR